MQRLCDTLHLTCKPQHLTIQLTLVSFVIRVPKGGGCGFNRPTVMIKMFQEFHKNQDPRHKQAVTKLPHLLVGVEISSFGLMQVGVENSSIGFELVGVTNRWRRAAARAGGGVLKVWSSCWFLNRTKVNESLNPQIWRIWWNREKITHLFTLVFILFFWTDLSLVWGVRQVQAFGKEWLLVKGKTKTLQKYLDHWKHSKD